MISFKRSIIRPVVLGLALTGILGLAAACGDDEAVAPVVIEKEVIKEVEVPVVVEKEVIKEVEVERVVVKEVIKEVERPVTFSIVGGQIATDHIYPEVVVPYVEEIIPQRSGGKISIRTTTLVELGLTAFDSLRLLKEGIVPLTWFNMGFIAGDLSLAEGVDLGGLYPNYKNQAPVIAAMAAWRDVLNEGPLKEKFNAEILGLYFNPPQVISCKPRITKYDDLKGLRVRVSNPSQAQVVEGAGGVPVTMAFAEVYGALERGVLDCGVTGVGGVQGQRWYEVTTTLYTLPVNWAVAGHMWSLDFANSLPPAFRTLLKNIFVNEMPPEFIAVTNKIGQDSLDCNVGRPTCKLGTPGNMVLLEPTDADAARIRLALEEVILPSWVKRCGIECGKAFNTALAPIVGVTADVS